MKPKALPKVPVMAFVDQYRQNRDYLPSAFKPAFSIRLACGRADQPGEHFPAGVTPSAASQLELFATDIWAAALDSLCPQERRPKRVEVSPLFAHAPIHPGNQTRASAAAPHTMIANGIRCSASSVLPFPIPDGEVLNA